MDAHHLHLVFNHLPIFGSIFGFFILIYALITRSRHVRIAAAGILLVSSLGGLAANKTGEETEEVLENQAGINENLIHEHEEAAEAAFPFVVANGLIALLALFADLTNKTWSKYTAILLLLTAAGTAVMTGRAGWEGGKIRHFPPASELPVTGGGEHESDD